LLEGDEKGTRRPKWRARRLSRFYRKKTLKERGALLQLGLLEGNEKGCVETLGDPGGGELEGAADDSVEGPAEEGTGCSHY
jgi:hypothetical protein